MRILAALILVVSFTLAVAQKTPNLVGTWRPDPASIKLGKAISAMELTLMPAGKFKIKGLNVTGEGIYTVRGKVLALLLNKRNGVKPSPKERSAMGMVAPDGKSISLPSGQSKNGKDLMIKLIRK